MRKLSLLFFALSFHFIAYGQKLNGKYQEVGREADIGKWEIAFSGNSFILNIPGDMGSTIGHGKFTVKDNLLTLNFQESVSSDTSTYTLESEMNKAGHANIDAKVTDENGIPLKALMGVRDKSNSPIASAFTDNNGTGQIILFSNRAIGYFTLDVMGFKRITIPINRLLGKNSNISAKFKPVTNTEIEAHKETYKITKITAEELILVGKNRIVKMVKIK